MTASGLARLTTTLLLLAASRLAGAESALLPQGAEFRVSPVGQTYYDRSDGYAMEPWVKRTSNDGFVVVWEGRDTSYSYSTYETSSGAGIWGRRFDAAAKAMGNPFTVYFEPDTYLGYFNPSLAVDGSDRFIVAWSNYEYPGPSSRVWARRYNAGGNPMGGRVQANTTDADTNAQTFTGVAAAPSGEFIVVWDGFAPGTYDNNGVHARRFGADGNPAGPEFQVNTTETSTRGYPTATCDADGHFTVAWQLPGETLGQRYDTTGAPLGSEFPILDHDNNESENRIAAAPDGRLMMVGFGDATSCCSLTGRLLAADGVPLGPEFVVDDTSNDYATTYGTVAADRDGAFLFAWQRAEPPFGSIYARRYTRDGEPDGPITLVSESTDDFPIGNPGLDVPSVAADSHGDFVVVWSNFYGKSPYYPNPGPQDGPGIWGRTIAVCGNGRIGRTQTCDDGNAIPGDGCSGRCDVETCFGCAGEPSACTPITGCHTTCVDGAPMADNAILTLQGTKAVAGRQSLKLKAAIPDPPFAPLEYDPSVHGMEIAVTAANALVWEGSIPAGPFGSGCSPRDGWKRSGAGAWQYVNKSGAIPPACVPGSARGLRSVKVRDRLATGSGIAVDAKVAKTTFGVANPVPPALATVVLGRSPDAGLTGKCGRILLRTAIGTRFYP